MSKVLTMPDAADERKKLPLATGLLDYFPDALIAVTQVSFIGNQQHNLGGAMKWDRSKSQDEADAALRHFLCRDEVDTDGILHAAKAAWRMLAFLQKKIEADQVQAKEKTQWVPPTIGLTSLESPKSLNTPTQIHLD